MTPSGEVLHLKEIGKPKESEDEGGQSMGKVGDSAAVDRGDPSDAERTNLGVQSPEELEALPEILDFSPRDHWPISTTRSLRPHFSDATIAALHTLYVEGRDPPPPKSDEGWKSRKTQESAEETAINADEEISAGPSQVMDRGRGQGRDRGRGRGARGVRGGRGGGRGTEEKWWTVRGDDREVVSQVERFHFLSLCQAYWDVQPIPIKEDRTAAHQIIRELFNGSFETAARDAGEAGQKLVVKWTQGNSQRSEGGREKRRNGELLCETPLHAKTN